MNAQAGGAMTGLRVIDLTRVLGGPYCTQILADHGADVIKVEPPAGDEVRDWGPPFHEEDAAYFVGINRNKRSIGLDLASEGGRAVLLRMLETADVLIENFKPGTLDKWGIGNDVLRAKFPRLVHCRISGFGGDGPRGGNPGYDAIIQAMTGMIAATGSPESGPMRIGVPLVDITTGLYAAIGILMALSERQRSGLGQFLETTLYETGLAIMHPHTANFFMHGKPPGLTGNEHPNLVPYAIFPTRTDDIFIGVGNDGTFRKLAREIGKPELGTDPRFQVDAEGIWRLDTNFTKTDPVLYRQLALAVARFGVAPSQEVATGGADLNLARESGAAILDLQQDGTHYFDLHHTPDDTLDKIDRAELRQNVAVYAAAVWLAAEMDWDFRAPAAPQPVGAAR